MRHVRTTAVVTLAAAVSAGALFARPAAAASQDDAQPLRIAQNNGGGPNTFSLLQDIQRLQDQVRQLRGEIDTLKYQMKQNEQGQRDLYQNLDQRLSTLEHGGSGGGQSMSQDSGSNGGGYDGSGSDSSYGGSGSGSSGMSGSGYGGSSGENSSGSYGAGSRNSSGSGYDSSSQNEGSGTSSSHEYGAESDSRDDYSNGGSRVGSGKSDSSSPQIESQYQAAFKKLQNGQYDAAISAFQGFLDQYPESDSSDNAWYWLGEANYVQRNYEASIKAFQTVVNRFKGSSKVADSLYKIGVVQAEQGQTDNAQGTLQRVIDQYPDQHAAELAKQRLNSIRN